MDKLDPGLPPDASRRGPYPEPPPDEPGLVFRQLLVSSRRGPFWQEWFCPVPPDEVPFQVMMEEWPDLPGGFPVRRIYQIRMSDHDRASPAAPPPCPAPEEG